MKIGRFWQSVEEIVYDSDERPYRFKLWGVSNQSDADAAAHAKQRLADAKTRFLNQDGTSWYAYRGSMAREEMLQAIPNHEQMDTAITRNRYGAMVLNTENMFIADIDVLPTPRLSIWAWVKHKLGGPAPLSAKAAQLQHIKQFHAEYAADYAMRVYETCFGFRVIVTSHHLPASQLQDDDSVANQLLAGLQADPLYILLCRQQVCYRARLSPKPWRMDVPTLSIIWPRPTPAHAVEVAEWLADYNDQSRHYAVCRLAAELPSKDRRSTLPDIRSVLAIHDQHCFGRHHDLPLA